jgi:RimJ/RimL family protein N-acetyltransferase
MFKVVRDEGGAAVGSVGYWQKQWRDGTVYETGWFVLPAFQGRGIATAATALVVDEVRSERRHRYLHAFPSVENAASNAVCSKVGFTLLEEAIGFEFPPGNLLRCNDWRLDLTETA